MYGVQKIPDRTSLCPYCQTIFWGSIICIVLSPLLITGTLFTKFGRWVTKLETTRIDKVFNWIDDKTPVIKMLEEAPDNFEESPLVSGLVYTIMGITGVAIVGSMIALAGMFFGGIGYGIWNIFDVFGYIWTGILMLGWVVFQVCGGIIGFAMHEISDGATWLFTNGPLWETIGDWFAYIVIRVVVVGLAAVGIGYSVMTLSKFKSFQSWWQSIVTMVNGFSEAKKIRRERIAEQQKQRRHWVCQFCKKTETEYYHFCGYCSYEREIPKSKTAIILRRIIESIMGKVHKTGSGNFKVLGWVSTVWEMIKAFKKGVCPLVEFASTKEIQEKVAKARKQERDDKREHI